MSGRISIYNRYPIRVNIVKSIAITGPYNAQLQHQNRGRRENPIPTEVTAAPGSTSKNKPKAGTEVKQLASGQLSQPQK